MKCRILKSGNCTITSKFGGTRGHKGIDLVKEGMELDYITAHSDGLVIEFRNNYRTTDKTGNSYGNYVKIEHSDNYYTLYAHMKFNSVTVKTGDKVKKGQVIGYMGNTGYSLGGHLHFELIKGSEKINPEPYLNKDLPVNKQVTTNLKYKLNDQVTINGVYVSSQSDKMLKPAITKGKITRIVNGSRNPYLLDNGNIGWVNDKCIVGLVNTTKTMTVTNCSYLNLRTSPMYGSNIYTTVKKGTKVEFLGISNGWAKIKYKNKELYCGRSYLI